MVHVVFDDCALMRGIRSRGSSRPSGRRLPFTVTEDANQNTVIATKRLRIVAERDSASLVFEDATGKVLVRESASPRPRELTPIDG